MVGTTAIAFFVSTLIQALIIVNNTSYIPTAWQGTLLFWAVLLVCVAMNTVLSSALPTIETVVLILHILGFFAIMIPLLYLAPKNNAHDVFTTFYNKGGWNTQALSFFVGLNGNVIAFVGMILSPRNGHVLILLTLIKAQMALSTCVELDRRLNGLS